MPEIVEIMNPDEKARICDNTLRALPSWFGIEEATVEYTANSCEMPFFAALAGGTEAGFVALKLHNAYTAEVYVMGILADYHRHGIGRALISHCEVFCKRNKIEFLTVKTLDESRENEEYARTRLFYQAMGFKPLEVFPLLWGEENPCLFLAKHL